MFFSFGPDKLDHSYGYKLEERYHMTVIVESKKMKVTQAIRSFAQNQANKLKKLEKGVSQVRIYLENIRNKKSDTFSNMVTYHIAIPGKDIIVKKHASDMYAAIVDATQGAVRKLRKVSEKRMTMQRKIRN
jgi:putative sigma-54 modulation protein